MHVDRVGAEALLRLTRLLLPPLPAPCLPVQLSFTFSALLFPYSCSLLSLSLLPWLLFSAAVSFLRLSSPAAVLYSPSACFPRLSSLRLSPSLGSLPLQLSSIDFSILPPSSRAAVGYRADFLPLPTSRGDSLRHVSAPFYLTPFKKGGTDYVDGAIYANCPAKVALDKKGKLWPTTARASTSFFRWARGCRSAAGPRYRGCSGTASSSRS